MIKRFLTILFMFILLFPFIAGCDTKPVPIPITLPETATPAPASDTSLNTAYPETVIKEELPYPPAASHPVAKEKQPAALKTFKALASEELNGRSMGSPGGSEAQKLLCSSFSQLGLTPWSKSFDTPVFINRFKRKPVSLSIKKEGAPNHYLMAGSDFFVLPGTENVGEYRVVFKGPVYDNEKVLFMIDDENMSEITQQPDNAIGYVHRMSPLYHSLYRGSAPNLHIFLSDEVFEKLLNYDGSASLVCNIPEAKNIETIDGKNIIGLLEGKNKEECLILSAHFDGDVSGTAALDNASGIYALLRIADKFSSLAREYDLERDIVFAAFDGEENGLIGSAHLAEQIRTKYRRAIHVNFDCVGLKGSDSYMVLGDSTSADQLIKGIYKELEDKGFTTVPVSGNFLSDHVTFSSYQIPAATIGEHDIAGKIHSADDVIENVDTNEIDRLTDAVYSYLLENCDSLCTEY